ncbi:hypothetical protein DER46DRAFT_579999 [Fusarium sp. MPI-SDFR-AT-0072]|nr:hypothetical protein DER46DRAFT_579999 [Fusarium sp. MPI-SDFR-AT-0072]
MMEVHFKAGTTQVEPPKDDILKRHKSARRSAQEYNEKTKLLTFKVFDTFDNAGKVKDELWNLLGKEKVLGEWDVQGLFFMTSNGEVFNAMEDERLLKYIFGLGSKIITGLSDMSMVKTLAGLLEDFLRRLEHSRRHRILTVVAGRSWPVACKRVLASQLRENYIVTVDSERRAQTHVILWLSYGSNRRDSDGPQSKTVMIVSVSMNPSVVLVCKGSSP